jgi:uncharacterized protein
MLCDTGPLVALVDEDDANHDRCVQTLGRLPPRPLVTTWPCVTEAMYLLGRIGGHPAQERLWLYFDRGLVVVHLGDEQERRRMRDLMRQYQDTPMDLADASLVAAAEALGEHRVFTLDSHFRAYRIGAAGTFEVVP